MRLGPVGIFLLYRLCALVNPQPSPVRSFIRSPPLRNAAAKKGRSTAQDDADDELVAQHHLRR